jgi:hypothetical protein
VKLEVARDEATAHGSEGRKIAMTTNPHVMPSSLISTTVGSSKIASSRKCVAKTSCKKKRQMMLQFDGEEVVELSYDAAGADDGSVQHARFAEEDPSGDEGGVSVGVGSPSRAREGKRVGGSGHPGQGGYFCGEEEDEEEEEEGRHSMRAGAEDAGCPKEETWHKSKL